jgi:hypothetical protein
MYPFLYTCIVLLPPGVNPIAVTKYIIYFSNKPSVVNRTLVKQTNCMINNNYPKIMTICNKKTGF